MLQSWRLLGTDQNYDLKIRLFKPRDTALTCQLETNSVLPLLWRRKLTSKSSFFSFSGSVYYQGGYFTCADIKTCSVIIEYCRGITTMQFMPNIDKTASVFLKNGKCSDLQHWASGQYVIPFQIYLCTSIEYQNVNCPSISKNCLIPDWRWRCPCYYRSCCKKHTITFYCNNTAIVNTRS